MTPPLGTKAALGAALPGGSLGEVLRLAYPVVLAQMSMTAMGVVDSAMVGRLGATPLASVGFGSIWLWTFLTIFYGTASGVQTFVSQADGAGRPQRCGAWTWQAAYAVVPAASLAMLVIAVAMGPLLALLGPSAELQSTTIAYVLPRLPGEVAMAAGMALSSFFRGTGDTRTPLYTTLTANVVNAVLDYGLIFGKLGLPEWGVAGAGAATSAGSWLGTVLLGWGFLLPAAWVFGVWLDGGLTGAWLAGLIQVTALAAILSWRFRSGAWRHIRI